MKKIKDLSQNMKIFIALIIMLVIGIIIRWDTIKKEAGKSFNFFKKTEQVDTVVIKNNTQE